MPVVKIHAIVLKSYETGNSSEVVHVVCAEFGRLSVYARGMRRAKSRHAAILQPLSLVELTVFLKDGAEMATLRDAAFLMDHSALTSDLERFSVGLVLAETASASCNPMQPAPELFGSLLQALHDIDPRAQGAAIAAACHGMLSILLAAGYEVQIEEALTKPWPTDQPRPFVFWLEVANATIRGGGAQPHEAPRWPLPVDANAALFPLPSGAVRCIYEFHRGKAHLIPAAEAAQLFEGLIRIAEFHHDHGIKSADFWRELHG